MGAFPRDCPRNCKYFRCWDMSIDDITNVCSLLGRQVDDCDSDFIRVKCPLSESELKEACGEKDDDLDKWVPDPLMPNPEKDRMFHEAVKGFVSEIAPDAWK